MGIQKIELLKPQIKEDLLNMSVRDFIDKYDLINFKNIYNTIKEREIKEEKYKNKVYELIEELKEGVQLEIYPPFMVDYKSKLKSFKNKINDYLKKISNSSQSEETISYLEDIIEVCEAKILKIQGMDKKNKEIRPGQLKRINMSLKFTKLLKIQSELDNNIKYIGNKIHASLKIFEEIKRSLDK